ncbi:MAG: hypothetical protein QOH69_272 [Actinomycetota bacterium]|jgi:hypothetical protein|nr:hypothetical protein [Mycobacterium sp.]MDQ1545368.1 hypothetical protein [Actinomycetota bacterium]
MARDELLIIRLEELKEDVALVGKMLSRATTRGDQLTTVSEVVKLGGDGTIGQSLASARSKVDLLISDLSSDDEVTHRLDELQKDLSEAYNRLGTAAGAAAVVGERMRDLDSIMQSEHQKIEDSLFYSLDMITKIQAVINTLDSDIDQVAAWNKFDKLIDECEPLFTDYVDFLSGVALRDYRLDDGVATLADRVFKELVVGGLAVPARHGDLPTKLASLAKFQFPEWTVWDVPLAGYHAGLSRSSSIGESIIDDFRANHPTTFPSAAFAKQMFAEVYATCMVGLAYGYAALLLHLHPRKTRRTEDSPSAADRATVILATLDSYSRDDPAFGAHVKRLSDWWSVAAGGATVSEDDVVLFTDFASRVVSDRLAKGTRPAPYDPARWHGATDGVTTKAHVDPGRRHALVRDQLNAIWHLRLTDPATVAGLTADDLASTVRHGRSAGPAATHTLQRQARPTEAGGFGG